MRIVLDTNGLVSGVLTPFGACGEIVQAMMSSAITLCLDARILFEYEDVLRRPRFKIDENMIALLMEYILANSETHSTVPLLKPLPDPGDHPFLEVAVSARVDGLVTGNLKHFPPGSRCKMSVLSPRQFIDEMTRRRIK